MIDWVASKSSQATVKNKDKIIVICEKCNKPREQLFQVAKRKPEHICMSCVKQKHEIKTNEKVIYTCVDCGVQQEHLFRANRFKNWRCHHCAMVQGHKDGKFVIVQNSPSEEGRKRLSELAIQRWASQEYRDQMSGKKEQSKERRSGISKEIWSDEERLRRLSESIRNVWSREDYRDLKIEQSQKLWNNADYRLKQKSGYTPDVRLLISIKSKEFLLNPLNVAMLSKKTRDRFIQNPGLRKVWSDMTRQRYIDDPELSKKLSEYFKMVYINNPELREEISKRSKQLYINNPDLRVKVSQATRRSYERNPDIKRKISESSKATWQNEEYRSKMAVARANQPRESNIQRLLYQFLDDLNVGYHKEGEQTVVGPYVFDCMVPTRYKRLLIECQGDYWHTLEKAARKDKAKFTYIERYFPEYEIMYIWEHEFYAKDKVIGRLKAKLGIELEVINFDFKDLKIADNIPVKTLNSFFDAYHYIGKGRAGKCFGAYLGDELVACAVYSNLVRQNIEHQFEGKSLELARLCIHPNYQKFNLASYFVSRTFKSLECDNVISYCDTTVGHSGAVYKSLGFRLHHEVDPDYWYVDENGWVMHKKTLYSRAKRLSTTESEYAEKFGYIKKYGGKKLCFVKQISRGRSNV